MASWRLGGTEGEKRGREKKRVVIAVFVVLAYARDFPFSHRALEQKRQLLQLLPFSISHPPSRATQQLQKPQLLLRLVGHQRLDAISSRRASPLASWLGHLEFDEPPLSFVEAEGFVDADLKATERPI